MFKYFYPAFSNFSTLLESVAYIVTIAGIIAIFLTVKSFKNDQEKEINMNKQMLINNSIKVLKSFSEHIIPSISKSESLYKVQETKLREQLLNELNSKLPNNKKITTLPSNEKLNQEIEIQTCNRVNMGQIFNDLEQLSVYMNYDLIEDDLVYGAVHKVFLDFIVEHEKFLDYISSEDAPYQNVHKLADRWGEQNKLKQIEKKENALKKEKNELLNK